jgi:hypothetical protein
VPKVLEVAVLSDQITPLTLYPQGAQGHFNTSSILGTKTVTGQNPE